MSEQGEEQLLHCGPVDESEWSALELANARSAALHFKALAETAADEVASLRAQLAEEKAKHALTIQHSDKLGAQLGNARKALEEIIDAEKEFREQMGADWEGDPVSDACDRAKLLLTDEKGQQ